MIPAATGSLSFALTDTCTTMRASTSSEIRTVSTAFACCSSVAKPITSTGFLSAAVGERMDASVDCVCLDNSCTVSPPAAQLSAQRTPGPPEFVRIPTLRPAGSGWADRPVANVRNSSRVFARITPHCVNNASTAVSFVARAWNRSQRGKDWKSCYLGCMRIDRDDRSGKAASL